VCVPAKASLFLSLPTASGQRHAVLHRVHSQRPLTLRSFYQRQ
jgi:hypothetical protein